MMGSESIDDQALQAAALWAVRLRDGQDCAGEIAQWRSADPAHERAWARVSQLEARLASLHASPPADMRQAMRQTLAGSGLSRRQLLRTLACFGMLAPATWLAVSQWSGPYQSASGEIKRFTLADGSELMLNTDSAVEVHYTAAQRLIVLRRGEAMVKTVSDPRPLLIRTEHGRFVALGTHFAVRLGADGSQLSLQSGRVAIENLHEQRLRVAQPGEVWLFDGQSLQAPQPTGIDPNAWQQRRLVLDHARLDAVCAELSRYRMGWLRCDPAVAALTISGVFVQEDPEQMLATLAQVLPIEVHYRSRYWVSLVKKHA
jgi:transmembrane sensor